MDCAGTQAPFAASLVRGPALGLVDVIRNLYIDPAAWTFVLK
jgi:hypothetical protein